MTAEGTNTWLLGQRQVAVIDPGPDDPAHVAAILGALGPGAEISHILVTHAHADHSGAVPRLKAATGAEVLAFGQATEGRAPAMAALAAREGLAGGEGIDAAFAPDRRLAPGARVESDEWRLTALHTPGHLSSHMCFVLEDAAAVFTGDTVMGWSSTLISPPDGSVSEYLASIDLLMDRSEDLYLPGHGAAVPQGRALAASQKAHRLGRAAEIVAGLEKGPATLAALTAGIYADLPERLHRAAMRNVLAHLIDLSLQGRVALPDGPLDRGSFRLS
ncbi:MBL fold metallo-hydrolase [Halovulum dunhuangense]|uniref:MBL fold metallo-hydrolase n=2 Tax=Halovulum dunhuangense TaxID=1505036 RepID=A0A849L2Q8_9RHOB|nr:MBL fold metallo-hydrolase [Halovulum dunhuangense]NNU80606.1 MBL fold metallo-hydrolase [Halovulum dunhuangense]